VSYAQEKDRPVIKDDITNISCQDEFYNVVFSHHVLGLCPDYQKAYDEMLRVCKRDGFVITCNSVPGNPKKHYSLVNSAHEVLDMLHFIHSNIYKHEVVYFDY
jgi:ubiquinone/menaquinone biosynthesis C-methylase UbiE